MTTIIDQTEQPALWNAINNIHVDDLEKGWVLYDNKLYQVMYKTDGSKIFLEYESEELYDSRSISGSKPAQYNKLDDG